MEFLWAVISGIVAAEIYLWLPSFANRLLRYNAAKCPPEISLRLLEEWQAHLNDAPGNLSKFLFALDLFRGRIRIIHEYYFPEVQFHPFRLFVIRSLDILWSATLLLAMAPVFLLSALLIKLDSPGPIFQRSTRIGKRGCPFVLLKFRTQVHLSDDLTRVGKFLRLYALDELPQVINILKGEMSLVGPRPMSVRDVERIDVQQHKRRSSVKPGVVCLWQVSGRRNMSLDEWVRMDLEYVDKQSPGLNLKIMMKTIPQVLPSLFSACTPYIRSLLARFGSWWPPRD
jgi:lipopolysaccharide/colanic/teichoic acid biosynthesis glycosyltransferase